MATALGTALGTSLRLALGNTQTPFETVKELAATRPVFTADYYVLDPLSGKVYAFVDHNDPTHWLVQADSNKQVAAPLPHADFGGRLCVTFTGAEYYVSNRGITAAHDFLQNGPCDFAMVATFTSINATRICWENTDGTNGGSQLFVTSSGTLRHNVFRTGSTAFVETALALNTPHYAHGWLNAGETPNRSIQRNSSPSVTAALGGTGRAGTGPLTFGGRAASLFLQGRVVVLGMFFPALSAANRASVHQYVRATYGIKLVPDFGDILLLSAGRPVFTADLCIEDPTHPGYVLRIVDHNDPTHWLEQTDPAKQVAMPAAHADFGGRLCFNFTGAEYYDSNRSIAYWQYMHNGTGGGCYAVLTLTDLAASRFVAMNRGNANRGFDLAFFTTPFVAGQVLTTAGTVVNANITPPAVGTPVQVGFNYLEGGATPSEYAFKITGAAELTGNSTGAPDAADALTTMRVGARGVSNDFQFRGRLAFIAFPGAFDATGRATMRAGLQGLTGVAA